MLIHQEYLNTFSLTVCVKTWDTSSICFYLPHSMDGFRVVKLNEVVRQMDMVITCTGMSGYSWLDSTFKSISSVPCGSNQHNTSSQMPLQLSCCETVRPLTAVIVCSLGKIIIAQQEIKDLCKNICWGLHECCMVSACQRHSFILNLSLFINKCIHFKCNIKLLLLLISNINIFKHGKICLICFCSLFDIFS